MAEIRAKEVTTSSSETSATIELPKNLPTETKSEIGEFLIEQILSSVQSRKSPVTGERFTPLQSKEYKSDKRDAGLSAVADLELSGKMLDSLDYRVEGDEIVIGVFGEPAARADGHNNLSGDSKLPRRQFIPGKGEGFVSRIEKEISRIIADSVGTGVEAAQAIDSLQGVSSKTSLYDTLKTVFPLDSRTEIKSAVLRSDFWTSTLRGLGLLKWL